MARGRQFLRAPAGGRPRAHAIRLGPGRAQVPGLFRRHPDDLRWAHQSQGHLQDQGAGRSPAAHLHAVPQRGHGGLAEKIAQITPGKLQKSFFTNSGTEANEAALLLARMATGSFDIIGLRHGYSGASALAKSVTGAKPPGARPASSALAWRMPSILIATAARWALNIPIAAWPARTTWKI